MCEWSWGEIGKQAAARISKKRTTQVCIGCGCCRWAERAEDRVLLRFWYLWHFTFNCWYRSQYLSCRTYGNQWQQFCGKTDTPIKLVWCKVSRITGSCSYMSSFPWRAEFFLRARVPQLVRKFQNDFMKLEPSLSCSEKPTSIPYPDARERRKDEWFWRREMPQYLSPTHKKEDGIRSKLPAERQRNYASIDGRSKQLFSAPQRPENLFSAE